MINPPRPGWSDRRWSSGRPILAAAIVLMVAAIVHTQSSPFKAELTADRIQSTLLEIRLAEGAPAPGLTQATIQNSTERVYLHDMPVVTNNDVLQARLTESDGHFSIAVRFSPEGAAKMATATTAHIGRPLAVIVNGEVIAAPTVRAVIADQAVISGNFTRTEAENIASGLQR
jgi:preprotein translocase subunit SecD